MVNKPSKYLVIQEYKSPYPHPIVFHEGDLIEVRDEFSEDPEWLNWVWCVGEGDLQAWVPKQFLEIEGKEGVFIREYNAMELSISVGERLLVSEIVNGFGMAEKSDGIKGWVPMRNLKLNEDPS
jgi:hypothetical protein